MKHRSWIALSGVLWFAIGMFLLYKGLHFISDARNIPNSLCVRFQDVFGSPSQAGTVLMFIALMVGFAKGRFVLAKTVQRVVRRIQSLPLPIRFSQVYTPAYWMLIGGMVMLGMVFRFLPIPIDARGFIDVAIGSALINGAMLYFRAARSITVQS